MLRLWLIVTTLILLTPAQAEQVVMAVSSERVAINSNFSGTELTVFGSIERDGSSVSRAGDYDVVVVVKGPPADVVTRKKERIFGVWINRNSRTFLGIPSFYALLSNKPIDDIAQSQALKANQLGLTNITFPVSADSIEAPGNPADFSEAYRRLKAEDDLFSMSDDGVEFLTRTLFKSQVQIPSRVPVGTYRIEVFVFKQGTLLAHDEQTLWISKAGLEQIVYDFSRQEGLLFGIAAVLLAIFVGWFGGVVFRRE